MSVSFYLWSTNNTSFFKCQIRTTNISPPPPIFRVSTYWNVIITAIYWCKNELSQEVTSYSWLTWPPIINHLFTESGWGKLTNRHYPHQTTRRLASNCWKLVEILTVHNTTSGVERFPTLPLLPLPRIWAICQINFKHAQNSEGSVQVQPSSHSQKTLRLYNFAVLPSIMDERETIYLSSPHSWCTSCLGREFRTAEPRAMFSIK